MKLKIIDRKISELIPAEYNPRQLTKTQHKHLKASLKKYGLIDPIIINMHRDRKNIIIGGHQRLKIWQEMGNDSVPCVELCLTLKEERELNVRLNANTGEWDVDLLANNFELDELDSWGMAIQFPEQENENETDKKAKDKKLCPHCGKEI